MTSLVEKFRVACLMRGANGIVSIGKLFRIVDDDNDRMVNLQEFKKVVLGMIFNLNIFSIKTYDFYFQNLG
jgi:hypothetical protein